MQTFLNSLDKIVYWSRIQNNYLVYTYNKYSCLIVLENLVHLKYDEQFDLYDKLFSQQGDPRSFILLIMGLYLHQEVGKIGFIYQLIIN